MSEKDLIAMLITKMDDIKSDINERLDKHETKLDAQTEKLNDFEVKANSVLAAHEVDLTNLKEEVKQLKAKNDAKESKNPVYAFLNSDFGTLVFRIVLILMMLLVGVKKEVVKDALDLFTSTAPKTELVKEK